MHKSRSKLNYALVCIVSLAIIGSGFVRDSIFRSINWQITHFQTDNPVLVRSSFCHKLFLHFSTNELYAAKWILTIIFSILFFAYTVIGTRLIYQTKHYTKTIAILFISVFILSALAYGIGYFTGNLSQGYHFARIFMGAVQSPFILLILIPAIKLSKLQNSI